MRARIPTRMNSVPTAPEMPAIATLGPSGVLAARVVTEPQQGRRVASVARRVAVVGVVSGDDDDASGSSRDARTRAETPRGRRRRASGRRTTRRDAGGSASAADASVDIGADARER